MKPKEFLITYVKKFNAGDISSLLALYETDPCFISQPGQVVNGLENIRQALQTLVDVNGKLKKSKRCNSNK
jgi:ketosteroid isomerase-like protein